MKKLLPALLMYALAVASHAQFVKIVVEEIDNEGTVPGRTYRIYAELTNEGDQLYLVYGDSLHPLSISSTKPFYQNQYGGAFAKDVNRKLAMENDSLRYDSWLTIGAADNYNNNVAPLNADTKNFEENGDAVVCNVDGCWFCLPTHKQAYCGSDKKILLMQLTTEGSITGTINIMGKTAAGEMYRNYDVAFKAN
ncbi:MAG: hypothetical protein ACKVOR_10935 [Flavobacteriales bacterium]